MAEQPGFSAGEPMTDSDFFPEDTAAEELNTEIDDTSAGPSDIQPQQSSLRTSRRRMKRLAINQCKECGNTFKLPSRLKKHELTHSKKRPYKCTLDGCVNTFKSRDGLLNHKREYHGDRAYSCSFNGCKKTFIQPYRLREHEATCRWK